MPSIAFTYNDPVIWGEFVIDISRVARERGIKSVMVTAGYITPEARPEVFRYIDAANVDLKAFTENFYRKLTFSHLEPVLDTLRWLKRETDIWFEITNLMIPGENDDVDETKRLCDWIVENLGDSVPLHFTAFHPDFKLMDKPGTPAATLKKARQIAQSSGIRYCYVGNVSDDEGQTTYCPACHRAVIRRSWHEVLDYRLNGSQCSCGAEIPGFFSKEMPLAAAPSKSTRGALASTCDLPGELLEFVFYRKRYFIERSHFAGRDLTPPLFKYRKGDVRPFWKSHLVVPASKAGLT